MTRRAPTRIDLPTAARAQKPVWRSLEDRTRTPEQRRKVAETELSEDQRGGGAGELLSAASLTASRRTFLKASTTAAAAAGLSGCIRRPVENILPYSTAPEYTLPGVAQHFATVVERRGDAIGLRVTTYTGRPTKVEGNTDHPGSYGATDVYAQGMIMDLYDPDRSESPMRRSGDGHEAARWNDFYTAYRDALAAHEDSGGAGLRVLMQPTSSPTAARLVAKFQERFPQAAVHYWEPLHHESVIEATTEALGQPAYPFHNYDSAEVVLALDSDFLGTEPAAVRAARRFSRSRDLSSSSDAGSMNRLYVAEPNLTITGAKADHRLPLPAGRVGEYLKALAKDLVSHFGVQVAPELQPIVEAASSDGIDPMWLSTESGAERVGVAADLAARQGRSVIVVGSRQPAWVHALSYAINQGLMALSPEGARIAPNILFGPTPHAVRPTESVQELAAAIGDGEVQTLVVLGGNPAYDAPADLGFAAAMGQVENVFALTDRLDETGSRASWHCPLAHPLESWGDARSLEGAVAIQQPMIQPIWHGAKSALELLGIAAGERNWRGFALVRRTFREGLAEGQLGTEQAWRSALHRGVVAGSVGRPLREPLRADRIAALLTSAESTGTEGIEVNFFACGKLFDGRHANNIWLQELPEAMSKIVWDNAALVSPHTAEELGLHDGDMVSLTAEGRTLEEIAIFRVPGIADGTVNIALGHGRGRQAGRYAYNEDDLYGAGPELHGGGFNAYPLRSTGSQWTLRAQLSALGKQYFIARTQEHGLMSGLSHQEPRPIVIDATTDEYEETPDFAQFRAVEMTHSDPMNPEAPPPGGPLWEPVDYSQGHKWGMTIDLTTCTGCNTCVIACQAENNIPSVGKRQVARGREMYWLRIDRYFVGDDMTNPQIALQPIGCQHCEAAPCENVCPVNATVHSPEGMNDMAYNRCIGTRYCANNCPYKVRRFNYLSWHGYLNSRIADYDQIPQPQEMMFNPNVTVRMRGVMEKCSYCVQRLQEAKISSKREQYHDPSPDAYSEPRNEYALRRVREKIRAGEVQSACQQACPTGAIKFGDLNDEESDVARKANMDRHYRLLAELGTRPRTTFLGQIRNVNPAMAPAHGAGEHGGDDHGHGHEEAEG